MSGRRRGIAATFLRAGLWVASWPYRVAVGHRNRGFDSGRRPIQSCGVPVVSVGNLTTGGTGKTPVVAYLAQRFRNEGLRVSIVSRGYGRGDADENDEAAELHQRLPDVPHVQDPDRVEAARIAVEELESQLILMDDGFQHRRLHRDLNLVLIDLTCPFGYGHLLPRGLLREPIKGIRRADAVILTRCDQVGPQQVDQVVSVVRSHQPDLVIVKSTHRASGLLQYPARRSDANELAHANVALVSGIGNPDAFRHSVEQLGANVVAELQLPDHASFDRDTMDEVKSWIAEQRDCDRIVCTQKDLVKLQTDRIAGMPVVALLIEAELESSPEFEQLLQGVAAMAAEA